jgi:hypothetical protein
MPSDVRVLFRHSHRQRQFSTAVTTYPETQHPSFLWVTCVHKKAQDLQETLIAINGLLDCPFISEPTRTQLETFRAELECELRLLFCEPRDVAIAS